MKHWRSKSAVKAFWCHEGKKKIPNVTRDHWLSQSIYTPKIFNSKIWARFPEHPTEEQLCVALLCLLLLTYELTPVVISFCVENLTHFESKWIVVAWKPGSHVLVYAVSIRRLGFDPSVSFSCLPLLFWTIRLYYFRAFVAIIVWEPSRKQRCKLTVDL